MRNSRSTTWSLRATALLALGLLGTLMAGEEARAAQTQTETRVRILLYSGRPDPEFTLEGGAQAAAKLRALVESGRRAEQFTGDTVIPAILGYKGVLVQGAEGSGLPRSLAVYRGTAEVRDGETRFVVDEGRELERTLLTLAVERGLVDGKLLAAEDLVVEPDAAPDEEPPEDEPQP